MYEVEVKVKFRAGHRLLPPYEGHCNNPHGEGYTAILFFEREILNKDGMVFDFGNIKKLIKNWIDNNWDHSYIYHKNDEIGIYLKEKGFRTYEMDSNPTAENMAKHLFEQISSIYPELYRVGIIESFDDSIAWYKR